MRYLLTAHGRQALIEHMKRGPLLGFDLDGTLAPIIADPNKVELPPPIRSLLGLVSLRFPLIVISGRARADVLRRLDGVSVREVYGNHGIEPEHASTALRERITGWAEVLGRHLAAWQGVWIEDKHYSVTVHYRQSSAPVRARAAALHVASGLQGARLIPGKLCLNLLPADVAHKGRALREAQERFGCETAIYFGDDHTDEDVFSTSNPSRVLGVRIGLKRTSAAAYYLRTQEEMALALALLRDAPQ